MTAIERITERDQPGWNLGYIAGEAERLVLATAVCDLRSDLRNARHMIADLIDQIRRLEDSP